MSFLDLLHRTQFEELFVTVEGGTYLFTVHLATHKDKKALISIRKNGKDVANIIAQARLLYSQLTRTDHCFE